MVKLIQLLYTVYQFWLADCRVSAAKLEEKDIITTASGTFNRVYLVPLLPSVPIGGFGASARWPGRKFDINPHNVI